MLSSAQSAAAAVAEQSKSGDDLQTTVDGPPATPAFVHLSFFLST